MAYWTVKNTKDLGFVGLMIWIIISPLAVHVMPLANSNASLSTTWINSNSSLDSRFYLDGSKVRPILWWGSEYSKIPDFACGFFCNGTCDIYLFSVLIVQLAVVSNDTSYGLGLPQVVWTANRNYPVKENATLKLNAQGEFFLMDADGALVWSVNATGRSVSGLHLAKTGNLILFDRKNSVVWQSFDHPTDSFVPVQGLHEGLKLRSSVSITNLSEGLYSFSVYRDEVVFFIGSSPPQVYLQRSIDALEIMPSDEIPRCIKLEPNGYMNVYSRRNGWRTSKPYITEILKNFQFPLVCGQYGICQNGECTCPISNYLKQKDPRQPSLGCTEITPLTCNESHFHRLVEVNQVTYFAFSVDIGNVSRESCKEACLSNCSCKAAFFRFSSTPSNGECYLPSQIFSLMDRYEDLVPYNISVFLKFQTTPGELSHVEASHKYVVARILGSVAGSIVGSVLLLGIIWLILSNKKKLEKIYDDEVEEDCLKIVSGMPIRFSFQELVIATQSFSIKVGEGGFGSVYKGSLKDGTNVAVKKLDGICPLKSSFLAEAGSIGSIHHVNLVRLIGYCAEKSHRLLVYEYMANGSLEKWIYKGSEENNLDWKCRKKIVLGIAKGLAYLHEECRQKIIHFDVKPQNILLDENFNARLSDFGMAKLIARDQSTIVTTLRGTLGYLAPDCLSSKITEKVDVYSFGVVMMEILCGRRLFDLSLPDIEQMRLLALFDKRAKEGQLLDMIENCSEDMKYKADEVLKMMQVAAWCLQTDFASRPSMSLLVKVLEGVVDIDLSHVNFNFLSPLTFAEKLPHFPSAKFTILSPQVLSGPR